VTAQRRRRQPPGTKGASTSGLLAWSLSASRFPAAYPGNPSWAYVVAGIGAAVVFLLGLLAHEVSHAVVAIRNGLSVEGIALWVFGGVARLRGEARTPGAELRIAGVGPLVSPLIGVGFGAVAGVLAAAGRTGLVPGTFSWLAGINIALAVFNVLPAARSTVADCCGPRCGKWRGDRTWAAITAARAGRLLGLLLIFFGLWQFLAGATIGALWLALIGWFLLGAAAAEEQQARPAGVRPAGGIAAPHRHPRPRFRPGSAPDGPAEAPSSGTSRSPPGETARSRTRPPRVVGRARLTRTVDGSAGR